MYKQWNIREDLKQYFLRIYTALQCRHEDILLKSPFHCVVKCIISIREEKCYLIALPFILFFLSLFKTMYSYILYKKNGVFLPFFLFFYCIDLERVGVKSKLSACVDILV